VAATPEKIGAESNRWALACVRITVPLLRDLVMLVLGSAGMTHELFFVPTPDMVRVWVCIGLLLGPAALNSLWRLRNPLPEQQTTSTGGSPSPAPSPSQPPGS
jgi:hypothetical protein